MIQFTNDNWEHRFERVNGILVFKRAIFREGNPKKVALKVNFTCEGEQKLKVIKFSDFVTESDTNNNIIDFTKIINKKFWINVEECNNIVISAISSENFDFTLEIDVVK